MKNCWKLCCMLLLFAALYSCSADDALSPEPEQDTSTNTLQKRSCDLHSHMEELLKNEDFKSKHELKFKRLAKFEQNIETRSECSQRTLLPVAVHYQGISNPDEACLRDLAIGQINILNEDFQGRNSDISTWNNQASSFFPGVNNGETCVEFCLAEKDHPAGFNLSDGDVAVTVNQVNGDSDARWAGYLNIFVRANTGVLGYAPLGGAGDGDGVVIDADAFGSGSGCNGVRPQSPYNLGRTLTHEVGHYVLLDHIWGNGCGVDDEVADTPDQSTDRNGCPSLGVQSCGSNDMHMNYMDYTNDACMYMFSNGQSTRAENYISSSLQNLVNKAATVCGADQSEPTCTDGIQNGDETGVDCGGSCEPCQEEPKCDDGIQNGDETGVDCGGSCEPCEKDPTCEDGIQNGDETGIDCGGSCTPCEEKPTCEDGIQNGDETGIDCGGSCEPCQEDGCEDFVVIVKPDDYGSEIQWYILDEEGYVVEEGGPYEDFDRSRQRTPVCLEDGCYTFLIEDAYGDGICCFYGRGKYRIKDSNGDEVIYGDGRYGYYDFQDFCVGEDGFVLRTHKGDQAPENQIEKNVHKDQKFDGEIKSQIKDWIKKGNDLKSFDAH